MEEAGHAMGWVLWQEATASALLSAQAFRHLMGRTRDKTVLVITTKSAQIWTQGTAFCPSIPTLGPAWGSSVPRTQVANTCFGPQWWGLWAYGNWRCVEGRAEEAGIYVLRGPLLDMNILVIVHFMAQSFAASFSNPDGLNWHFHYMCLH